MPVNNEEELRKTYKEPKGSVLKKILPKLEKHCINFIQHSPFIVISTSNKKGHADASPKGDAPGFVSVIDDKTLLIPDRVGNNIADSLRNILENPEIGIIFFIPGIRETLRVNGSCIITTNEKALTKLGVNGKLPRSAIEVSVHEAYLHCGKSIIRADLWGETNKIEQQAFPTLGAMLADQISGLDKDETDIHLEQSYKTNLY